MFFTLFWSHLSSIGLCRTAMVAKLIFCGIFCVVLWGCVFFVLILLSTYVELVVWQNFCFMSVTLFVSGTFMFWGLVA